jgi:N-acetylglucosaminyldiphosphoundecaprenol N-acetyl-beta-D-mannosaminyltransferase
MNIEREVLLGVGVSAINMQSTIDTIHGWIDRGQREYVCVTCVHGIMESFRSKELRDVHNRAGMVAPDGMPLVWLLWLTGHSKSDRVCGPELMPSVLQASIGRGDRHFFYGGTPASLKALAEQIRQFAPGARIVGSYSPPFRPLADAEDEEIVQMINESKADIVWCGLGMPKQELWMARHRDRLDAAVLIGVGAAFDVHAGVTTRAPAFLRRSGCEWVYRLLKEPKRLWRRYLGNNPLFLFLLVLQASRLLRFADETGPSVEA